MKVTQRQKRLSALLAIMIVMGGLLAACGTAATSAASCGFKVGTGDNDSDRSLHGLVYPSQKVDVSDNERVDYFPCNSRNYAINDGSVRDVNGNQVGDRFQPIRAYTKSGTAIDVSLTAFFTVNQDQDALNKFYNVCHKYTCASKDENAGDVNNSTPGWIDMLDENLGPALETTARSCTKTITDEIWRTQDTEQYKTLADCVSTNLNDTLRVRFGYQEDLFCGSGNSDWTDPSKPGEGEFTCSNVRIEITDVKLAKVDGSDGQSAAAANEQRLQNAEALYGDEAGYWLGVQDTVQQCKAAGVVCVFNIGGSPNSPSVSVPVTTPTPTPEPTESEENGG